MTRKKFAAAGRACLGVDKQWTLDSQAILKPVIAEKPDLNGALSSLDAFCSELKSEHFDMVINLSFSPFSSYLTEVIAGGLSEVRGYSRYEDGTLSIPDDSSAYFFAQVGGGRGNRIHVTDVFAAVAGVDLVESDWNTGAAVLNLPAKLSSEVGSYPVVVHVGASDLAKTFSWSKWLQIVRGLNATYHGAVVLVGSPEESEIAEKVAAVSGPRKVVNLVGKTTIEELFAVISKAAVVIGGDSAPVQIATLTGTQVLNVSFPMVNYWETGPRSAGSRIVTVDGDDSIASDVIVREAMAMILKTRTELQVVEVPGRTMPYVVTAGQSQLFEWELQKALYMSETFPPPPNETFLLAIQRLAEINSICLEQVEALKRNHQNKTAASILDRGDEIMAQIERVMPEAGPIVRWFQVERMRIGPQGIDQLIESTAEVHRRLALVLEVYGQVFTADLNVPLGGSNDDVNLG
ncbi:MAG: glycosyltransferase family 9 protein [Bdellovibrionota bacterium]